MSILRGSTVVTGSRLGEHERTTVQSSIPGTLHRCRLRRQSTPRIDADLHDDIALLFEAAGGLRIEVIGVGKAYPRTPLHAIADMRRSGV